MFIHSGNWAGTSLTPPTSSSANRDFGFIIHDRCVAEWFEKNIFQADLKIAAGQYAPATCSLSAFDKCSVCGGAGDSCKPETLKFDSCGLCPASYPSYTAASCSSGSQSSNAEGNGSGVPAGVIVAAVLVPLIFIAAIVGIALFLALTGRMTKIRDIFSRKVVGGTTTNGEYHLFTH